MAKTIGKVSATEKAPSTIDEFFFWTDKKQILSPFDVVKVQHEAGTTTFGVVEEICHVTDAPSHFTSYISSDFGDTREEIGNMNRLGMNYVKARVTMNTGDIYTPVLNGRQVSLCTEGEIKQALGLTEKDVKHPLVCGYLEMYKGEDKVKIKVILDSHFLIGPDGAHINISGISGLAAKTSYSMFLLRAIQSKFTLETGETCAFVFFNVKGRDLMAIDEPNDELENSERDKYAQLDIPCKPFGNVCYYYPYSKGESSKVQSYAVGNDVERQKASGKAFTYKFTYEENRERLDLLLANEDDSSGTLEGCVNYILNGEGAFNGITTWKSLKEEIDNCTRTVANGGPKGSEIQVVSWRKFKRCISKALSNDVFGKTLGVGEVDLGDHIQNHLKAGDVMVIDIARLDGNTQSFVFGSVARSIYDLKLGAERTDIPDKIILFVDELNKYASSDVPKNSPILKQLLDIAERGRSLGIILFSVEQFRSAIHDRVKGNCATQAYGRTNAIEVSKPDYRYIPKVYQNMMTRLAPGEYIISNPALRTLVNVKFPKPFYKQFPNG